jgi:hypothetical protein
MKKYSLNWALMIAWGLIALVACIASLALGSCAKEEKALPAPAQLILGFGGGASSAKSFIPDEIEVSIIKVEATGPGAVKLKASSSNYEPVELDLEPGSWIITAKGLNDNGIEIASGFVELSVGPSERIVRDLLLSPLVGEGTLALSWSLNGSLAGNLRIEGSLSNSDGTVLPIAVAFATESNAAGGSLRFEALRSGGWTLSLQLLADGAVVCGLAEGILVAAGMETKAALRFEPPTASLALGFVMPDYSSLALTVEPAQRIVARGTISAFRILDTGNCSWYLEGEKIGAGSAGTDFILPADAGNGVSSRRLDCLALGAAGPRSGSARVYYEDAQALGPVVWGERLEKATGSAAATSALRALGDCRDLAWSPDSSLIAVAGKGSGGIGFFEAAAPGATFDLGFLGASAQPGLAAPSILRFRSASSLLVLSEAEGAAYAVALTGSGQGLRASLAGSLADAALAGAKDLVIAGAGAAYVAAAGADAVALLGLDGEGKPISANVVLKAGPGGQTAFSKPACLALSSDGSVLAVGTTGDDAIYLLDRDAGTNALGLRQRLDKTAFPADAPLSDPCSLVFSNDGASLFVLSYYGKSLVRLELDAATGLFSPVAGIKSGSSGVSGFASPRRIAPSPDGRLLFVLGGGADDGLSLIDIEAPRALSYLGTMKSSEGKALPARPFALAISKDGAKLAIANDGSLSFFSRK